MKKYVRNKSSHLNEDRLNGRVNVVKATMTSSTTQEDNDMIHLVPRGKIIEHLIDVVSYVSTWNFRIYCFNDNVNTQQY